MKFLFLFFAEGERRERKKRGRKRGRKERRMERRKDEKMGEHILGSFSSDRKNEEMIN